MSQSVNQSTNFLLPSPSLHFLRNCFRSTIHRHAYGRDSLTLLPMRGAFRNFLPVRRLSAFHTFSKMLADSSLSFIRIAFAEAMLRPLVLLLLILLVLAAVRTCAWPSLCSFTTSTSQDQSKAKQKQKAGNDDIAYAALPPRQASLLIEPLTRLGWLHPCFFFPSLPPPLSLSLSLSLSLAFQPKLRSANHTKSAPIDRSAPHVVSFFSSPPVFGALRWMDKLKPPIGKQRRSGALSSACLSFTLGFSRCFLSPKLCIRWTFPSKVNPKQSNALQLRRQIARVRVSREYSHIVSISVQERRRPGEEKRGEHCNMLEDMCV